MPVVADAHGPRLFEGGEVAQLPAGLSSGDVGDGVDPGVGALCLVQDVADHLGAVHRGLGVGHGRHGGKPARSRSPAAGEDVLLIGEAGVPQVDVHVDEAGGSHQSGGFDDLVRLFVQLRGNSGNFAVLHQDIPHHIHGF